MDLTSVGSLAAQLMEKTEAALGDDVEVRQAFMVVEVDTGESLAYFKASTDDRGWVQEAFIDQFADALFHSGEPVGDDA